MSENLRATVTLRPDYETPGAAVPRKALPITGTVAERLSEVALPLALASIVAISVLHNGVPALRHDWRIPIARDAIAPWLEGFWNGWIPNGIGQAQAYPTFYLIGFSLWPLRELGPLFLTASIVASGIGLAAWGAFRLARASGSSRTYAAGAAAFCALNPWVYSKEVAGHVLMVFAYGVLLALAGETARSQPRRWLLATLAALTIVQIEFFLIALVPLLAWALRRRAISIVIVVLLTAAPVAVGIVSGYARVAATPFNLTWQDSQSIAPWPGFALAGYAFGYGDVFAPYWPIATGFGLAALAAMPAASRTLRGRTIAAIGALAFVLMTGTKGLAAGAYRFGIEHFAEFGVYRELYDLAGIVGIAYVGLGAIGPARRGPVAGLLAFGAFALAIPWIAAPPTAFFTPASALPQARDLASPHTRVAYFPAFQPFSYVAAGDAARPEGSGVDPDAYVREGRALPIDTFYPMFPLDAALGRATFSGDDRALRELGVSDVVERPYLQSNFAALRETWIETQPPRERPMHSHALRAWPLLSIVGRPVLATLANEPGDDAIFFGDAEPGAVALFPPTRATDDPRADWVDARLAFPAHPAWASALGGVVTESSEVLPLPRDARGTSLLALADGTLVDERGRVVVRDDDRLGWHALQAAARGVSCRGICVVAAQARVPPGLPSDGPRAIGRGLDYREFAPWLLRTEVPAGARGALRFAEAHDAGWLAFDARDAVLTHVRLASALNGWLLPFSAAPREIVIVDAVAAVQFALEILAATAIVGIWARETIGFARRRGRS